MAPDGPEYEAHALRCFACEAREAEHDKFARSENANMNGLKVSVTIKEEEGS